MNLSTLDAVRELRVALADSQRNHHTQMVNLRRSNIDTGTGTFGPLNWHKGAHFQQCPAQSCTRATNIWKGTMSIHRKLEKEAKK